MAGGIAQVVEHLPSKHEALNSKPSMVKRKKEGDLCLLHMKVSKRGEYKKISQVCQKMELRIQDLLYY
jgi:hypothetical protein